MDIKRYREEYEPLIEKADPYRAAQEKTRELLVTRQGSAKERAQAIEATGLNVEDVASVAGQYLATLRDPREAVTVRRAALNALKQGDFLGSRFDPYRADYREALREVATDESPTLRADALEVLALEGDGYAQEKLLEGLKSPDEALVPTWQAVQFLGYDDHSEALPAIRELFDEADQQTKEEALSILATDPESEDLLKGLLRDKSQPTEIRQRSAVALQNVAPEVFRQAAREIVADNDEYNEIRATCLAALSSEPDKGVADLVEQVFKLQTETKSRNLKSSAKRFIRAVEEYS